MSYWLRVIGEEFGGSDVWEEGEGMGDAFLDFFLPVGDGWIATGGRPIDKSRVLEHR